MSGHPIVHVDLPAQEPAETAKFYKEALGWELVLEPDFNYWMFKAGEGPGGGFVSPGAYDGNGSAERHEIGKPLIYLGSNDIEGDLAKVEACGGRTILGRTAIGDFGAFAVFADPAGNHMGFYQDVKAAA